MPISRRPRETGVSGESAPIGLGLSRHENRRTDPGPPHIGLWFASALAAVLAILVGCGGDGGPEHGDSVADEAAQADPRSGRAERDPQPRSVRGADSGSRRKGGPSSKGAGAGRKADDRRPEAPRRAEPGPGHDRAGPGSPAEQETAEPAAAPAAKAGGGRRRANRAEIAAAQPNRPRGSKRGGVDQSAVKAAARAAME